MPSSSSSRRSSASSLSSIVVASTPLLAHHRGDSAPGLVLVPDDDDGSDERIRRDDFELSSDDDIVDDISSRLDRLRASPIPPLPPPRVFIYLLLPNLVLGALLIPSSSPALPLSTSLPALFLCALAALAARRLSYMITKYVRKADLEDVVLDVLARGPARDRTRAWLRTAVRALTSAFRVLLASVYLQAATAVLEPHFPSNAPSVGTLPLGLSPRVLIALGLGLVVVLPLSLASSLASRVIRYTSEGALSVYALWLTAVTVAHAHGSLAPNPQWSALGPIWHYPIAPILFAFTSSWTLPLYAALKASSPRHLSVNTAKPSKRFSFLTLSALATALAALAILPLCFFAARPTGPVRASSPMPSSSVSPSLDFKDTSDGDHFDEEHSHLLVALSNAAVLTLAIPFLLITAPPLPPPLPARVRRAALAFPFSKLPLSKIVLFAATVVLAVVPPIRARAVLADVVLVGGVVGTYVLPAALHIIAHNLRSPLTIILPSTLPSTSIPSSNTPHPASDDPADELLRRKERMLQRRRLGRRVAWDAVAWALVLGFGGVGGVAVGMRVVGRW